MTHTGTLTLTDFLLARIAEDEVTARECAELDFAPGSLWELGVHFDRDYCEADDLTISPARVLADCEAKRRLIDWSAPVHGHERVPTDRPGVYDRRELRYVNEDGEDVLRYLALPYADHPDYDPDWRP